MRRLIKVATFAIVTGVLIGAAILEFQADRFASTVAFAALAAIAADITFEFYMED